MKSGNNVQLNDIEISIGSLIKARRLKLKLSQQVLADRSTLHRTYISDIEHGERHISLRSFLLIASALDMEPWQLLKDSQKYSLNRAGESQDKPIERAPVQNFTRDDNAEQHSY